MPLCLKLNHNLTNNKKIHKIVVLSKKYIFPVINKFIPLLFFKQN